MGKNLGGKMYSSCVMHQAHVVKERQFYTTKDDEIKKMGKTLRSIIVGIKVEFLQEFGFVTFLCALHDILEGNIQLVECFDPFKTIL